MRSIPKTLVFSRGVPPGASGSSVIIGNLIKQFSPSEMIVIGAKFTDSPPIVWNAKWPNIVHATLNPPDGWRGARALRWLQFPLLLLCGLWTAIMGRCAILLAVYPDEIYLLVAYLVSVATGKPLFLYFHNTYLEHARGNIMANWLQPRVFKRAKHVFVMSHAMQALYRKYYPDLVCTPLVHTFNEDLPTEAYLPAQRTGSPLRLALSGSVNASNEGAIEHLARAVKYLPDIELWMYSKTNQHYLNKIGVNGPQFHVNIVSRDDLMAELQKADILLLPHGFSERESREEIETVFPTRTVEYLIAGRPILAHVPEKCFITDFLREHDCALVVTEPDAEALKTAIVRLRNDMVLQRRLVTNAIQTARQFHAPLVTDHLREVLYSKYLQLAPRLL